MEIEKIYIAWPQEVVQETLQTFAEAMRDGAEIEQLQNGLIGLDFILRASELTEFQKDRYEALELEANWRISLMLDLEMSKKTEEENAREALKQIKIMQAQIKACCRIIMSGVPSAEQVYFHFYGRDLIQDRLNIGD